MLARGETRLEVMLKMIHQAKLALQRADPNAARNEAFWEDFWQRVKAQALRNQSAFKDEADDLLCFLRELGGGIENPCNLFYLRDFIRSLKVEKEIGGDMYGAVARVQVGNKHAAPRFRVAVLCAMAGASQQYSRNDEQALLTPADITAMATKHMIYVQQAEAMLERARGMIDLNDPHQKIVLYTLEVRLVHHVFRKADITRGSFKTQAEIGSQFVFELSHKLQRQIENPWASSKPAAPAKSSPGAAASSSGVVQFSSDGKVKNSRELIESEGFKVGIVVQRVSDKARFTIKEILDDSVQIEDSVGVSIHVFSVAFLEGKFKLIAQEKEVEYLENHHIYGPDSEQTYTFFAANISAMPDLQVFCSQHFSIV